MDDCREKNNCFLLIEEKKETENAPLQHEVFLYDEAEPLAYECSDTSMPPQVSAISRNRTIATIRDAEIARTPTDRSMGSEYYSVKSMPRNGTKPGFNGITNRQSGARRENNFQNAILSKYNEFSNSSKSLVQGETEYYKNSTDECEYSENPLNLMRKVTRKKSSKVREIFTRKSPIFESSSESEFSQSREKQSDQRFSIKVYDNTDEIEENTADVAKSPNMKSDEQWSTKSIAKMALGKGDVMRACSPHRKISSTRRIHKNTRPYCLFVEELKKNSLIMKEDIFASSKSKINVISKNVLFHDEKGITEVQEDIEQLPIIEVGKRALEVFEAKGCRESRGKSPGFNNEQHPQLGIPVMDASLMMKEQNQQTDCTERKSPMAHHVRNSGISKNVELPQQPSKTTKSIGINTNDSSHANSISTSHNSNESKSSNLIMPVNGTSSRYVKLPGFPEAFVKEDNYVKELRIKDGISFESINVCSTMTQEPSQFKILFLEQEATDVLTEPKQKQIHGSKNMKDESTNYELLMENRLTQTLSDMVVEKLMTDTSVQCESHIIDVVNDNTDYKNDHQEIMICNDLGRGMQLYNILGHPLTDMEGYLLKDSHGRFLVRFDNFGVPTTCTDGKTIFLEDGSKWENVKGHLNIIHQRCKKNIANKTEHNRINNMIEHHVERRSDNIKPLHHSKQIATLKWLGENSKSTLSDNSCQRIFEIRSDHNPLREIKFKPDPINSSGNTSTLVAEMKSIARLRNALLEKINFIADHRDPPQKPRFSTMNGTHSFKTMTKIPMLSNSSKTNWKSEPRIHSDRNRKPKLGFKSGRSSRKRRNVCDDKPNILFQNRKAHNLYSQLPPLKCVDELQNTFPTANWHSEAMGNLVANEDWQPSSHEELTILRQENFPPVSETSSFVGPWSSDTNSNAKSMTEQPIKWSAMRPSIGGESEENGF